MVVVPKPTIVIVFPATVATDNVELEKVTGKPEVAIAVIVNGASVPNSQSHLYSLAASLS